MSAIRKTMLMRSLQLGTSMGMLWLTAAWMGPALRGQTSMVMALAHAGVLISGFGAGSGMIYHASRFSTRALWLWSQVWACSAAILVGSLSWGFMEWTPLQSIMMGILTWFHASVAAGRGWLLGNGRLQEDNVLGWMIPLLPTLVLGSLYAYQQFGGQVHPTLDLFLIIQGAALGLVAAWSWFEIYFKDFQTKQTTVHVGKALWAFNRWTASANLGQFVVYRFQYLYMLTMLGAAELGIYSVAVVVAEGAWVITQTYSTVLLSSLSAHQGPPDEQQVRRSWGWCLQAFLWTLLPVAVLLFIPVTWISQVLGSAYEPVHGLWIALSPGILALACSNVLVQHFTALGRVRVSFFSSWGTAVLMVCGLGPALDLAGVQGIAWWTSLVLVANTVGVMAFFRMTYKAYL